MKFHFLFKEQESDIYSKGVNIYALNLIEAIFKFNEQYNEVVLLSIFTEKLKK